MNSPLHVIIFGASGYSGKQVVKQFHEITTKEKRNVTWGIAGRSKTKLQEVLKEMELKTEQSFAHIPIMEADTTNESSLMEMASKARLLMNCTGPYKFHGEPVVRACIQQNCHYIDITAEPQFMERMQLLYNKEAVKKGVYVVPACGFDCIPTDMGLDFLQKNFEGTLNSVECYQQLVADDGFAAGPMANETTWRSALHVLADLQELKEIRMKLFKESLPRLEPKLSMRWLHQIPLSKGFAGPYPSCDATVMRRPQRYSYEKDHSRPIQIHTYVGSTKIYHYLILFIGFLLGLILLKFQFGLDLLLKYPKLMSLGFFGSQPNEEDNEKYQFVTTFYGRGWKGKIVDEEYRQREDAWIVAKVSGRDGYKITGFCAAICAIVLLDGTQKLPKSGGVLTTASVFTNTSLIDILQRNGLKFELCDQGDL